MTALSAVLLLAYVQNGCAGQAWACFWPSAAFPAPPAVRAATSIRPTQAVGWDGQFYLFQAYDPFLRDPAATQTAFDAPAYRYQRNLLPALSWLLAHLPAPVSPAAWYMVVQLALMGAGSWVVAHYLAARERSMAWLVPLHLNNGVIATLWHGLPDASTDFLLYMAVVFALTRRPSRAALCVTALCLAREPYNAFAAALAAMTCLGAWPPVQRLLHRWAPDAQARWPRAPYLQAAGYAVGCAVFVAWHTYVRYRLHGSPTAQGQFMLSAPLLGLFEAWRRSMDDGLAAMHWTSTLYCAVAFCAVCTMLVRRLLWAPVCAALLVLCLVNSSIGWLGWYTVAHASKNFSHCLGLLPILAAMGPVRRARSVALAAFVGLAPAWVVLAQPKLSRAMPSATHGFYAVDLQVGYWADFAANRAALLADAGYDPARGAPPAAVVHAPDVALSLSQPVLRAPRRAAAFFTVVVHNAGKEALSPFADGSIPGVQFAVCVKDTTGRTIDDSRHSLNQFIYPQGLTSAQLAVLAPSKPGTYTVEVHLVQGKSLFGSDPLTQDTARMELQVVHRFAL
jgi:hypothetical protein